MGCDIVEGFKSVRYRHNVNIAGREHACNRTPAEPRKAVGNDLHPDPVGWVSIQTSASHFWGRQIHQIWARIPKKYLKRANTWRFEGDEDQAGLRKHDGGEISGKMAALFHQRKKEETVAALMNEPLWCILGRLFIS
jgi:hypothetical protein